MKLKIRLGLMLCSLNSDKHKGLGKHTNILLRTDIPELVGCAVVPLHTV
jgi:hypothetical protein